MKKYLLFISVIFSILLTYSQKETHAGCGTDEIHQKLLKEDLIYKENFERNSYDWQEYAIEKQNCK